MLQPLAENLWLLHYPAPLLGDYLGRNVTVIRLRSGQIVLHSTGPFTPEDVAAIQGLGQPGWLVDALSKHDTFAQQGRAAFPDLPYYAPAGFSEVVGFPTLSLGQPPTEWSGELECVHLNGMDPLDEYVFCHLPSRTLIVADLVFNVTGDAPWLARVFASLGLIGGHDHNVGMSRPERSSVVNPDAFRASLAKMQSWDYDRVIVGHGEVIPTDGKQLVNSALAAAGF